MGGDWKGYTGAISPGVVDPSDYDEEHPPRDEATLADLIREWDGVRGYADPLTAEELDAGLAYLERAYGYTAERIAELRRRMAAE